MGKITKIAVVSILIEKSESREEVNRIFQDFSQYVVGRLGIPYRKRALSVIVVVLDAPIEIVSSFAGKLGLLPGVNTKTIFSRQEFSDDADL